MNYNKRVNDLTEVFDSRWHANHNDNLFQDKLLIYKKEWILFKGIIEIISGD